MPKRIASRKSAPPPLRTSRSPNTVSEPAAIATAARSTAFPIVGLGASAGGLEALEEFFKHTPADTGMAFVVVTHQHAGHTSLLPDLLRRWTAMPVAEVTDNLRVKPNCIYVARPEGYLALLDARLHLMTAAEPSGLRLPIDYFFRSLAEDQRERAVGIILSGTASDGTLGIKAIKGATGLTMAQEPESAKYPGMPRSAIATGMVDCVLPPAQLPQRLAAYVTGPYAVPARPDEAVALPDSMLKIVVLLRSRTGHDFSAYKPTTIRRRIERRMNLHQVRGPLAYLELLQNNPHELDLLFKELLIGVTNFFRDPEAFATLGETVVKELLATRPDDAVVRVWVPGCATGEEAYSLAILLRECAERMGKRIALQIFGTDLDSHAIDTARAGVYPDGIAVDVSRERLARFFTKEDGHYRLKKEIREMVIFAPQNVVKDPPFTKLDIVSCRNLLIYFNAALQQQVLTLFHYALKPDGLLLLGSSESVGELHEHFTVVDKKAKIYRRSGGALPLLPPVEFGVETTAGAARPAPAAEASAPEPRLVAVFEKLLMGRFAPASVIVTERGDISFIHGRTGNYLEPAAGRPRNNLMEMAREGLRPVLSAALRGAAAKKCDVVHEGVRVKTNGHFTLVDVTVSRLAEPESIRGLFLVTFRPSPVQATRPGRGKKSGAASRPAPPGRVEELEQELLFTRESLQSTVEELQTASEEHKSSTEELQSANEELQSTNEELETSKEEMQSLNEELQTVNAQLRSKVEALTQSDDDMQNLLNSTAISAVFLDGRLNIRRFTEEARQTFNLIPTDAGRPIANLASNLNYDTLVDDAAEVLRTLVVCEREVPTKAGGWRLVRILPYRTMENVIDGVVITLVDITRIKQAEQAAQSNATYAESIVATAREPLLVLDRDLRVVSANRAFLRRFKMTVAEVEGQLIYDLGHGQWKIPELRRLLEKILPGNDHLEGFEVEHRFPVIGRRTMLLNARRLVQLPAQPGRILLAMEDVTPPSARSVATGKSAKKRPAP